MLRAQLLGGTPAELLGAITGLTEARFPVHAPVALQRRLRDRARERVEPPATPKRLSGRRSTRRQGAPVIAVQDGEIVAVGDTPSLGRYVSLRDAYGNTYTYAQLGSVATLYPVLEPHEHSAVSSADRAAGRRAANPRRAARPAPARSHARRCPKAPTVSGLALGAAADLEAPPAPPHPAGRLDRRRPATPAKRAARVPRRSRRCLPAPAEPRRAGARRDRPRARRSRGTSAADAGDPTAPARSAEPHMLFQIRPAGVGAPLIDPKPILDGWVQLENTSIFRAKGENPFLGNSPTVGQVLLESKEQLEQQVLSDRGIHLATCGRQDVQTGQVDRRVLATLEFLSVSGLHPTVSSLRCTHVAPADGRQRGRDLGRRRGRDRGRQRHRRSPDGSDPAQARSPKSRSTSC